MRPILYCAVSLTILIFSPQLLAAKKRSKVSRVDLDFKRVFNLYEIDAYKNTAIWQKLAEFQKNPKLSRKYRTPLRQLQARLLVEAGYPLAASFVAAATIQAVKDPGSKRMNPSWSILSRVSKKRPILFILEDLSLKLKLNGYPYKFGSDWNYVKANALLEKGFNDRASIFFKRINMSSRYFMPAKYQQAMLLIEAGNLKAAKSSLKAILLPSSRENSPISLSDKREMTNYAHMALGRILYQEKKFLTSARYFRKVRKDSPLYYDALFEQSWSLFMSGNGRHSLGSLYGIDSPFFADRQNPEAKILESIVFYWMCRYQDSRNSLADFAEEYTATVEKLGGYLNRRHLNPKNAYDLFENLVSGVSEDSLGIPRQILQIAANRDTMLLVRDQLASVMSELSRLRANGVFGNKVGFADIEKALQETQDKIKNRLGRIFIQEIKEEKSIYEELYSQAQFLYLELLMSEKEQIMGRELHKGGKLAQAGANEIRGWGLDTQSWKGGNKGEFWWDEVGFHIVDVENKCID